MSDHRRGGSQPHALWRNAFLAAFCILLLLLPARLQAQTETNAPARFAKGFPTAPTFFPIGVWLQNPRDAAAYKALGINTFVGLYQGPTEAHLDQLAKAGLFAVAAQNDIALRSPNGHVVRAWMQDDEPDNAQARPGGGYGDCVMPERIVEIYAALRARDPSRPVFMNFGQGVANKQWHGRGSTCSRIDHDAYYGKASRGADILSFDIYPASEFEQRHVAGRLELVAEGVANLQRWSSPGQRVWSIIGATHIAHPTRRPTPVEIRSMAWMSVISGARGLVYFVHEWKPSFSSNGVLRYPDAMAALKSINAELANLAPVINASPGTTTATASAGIAAMARTHNGRLHVFAVNLKNTATRAEIAIAGAAAQSGSVHGEPRPIRLDNGILTDDFPAYAVRLYEFPVL